MPAKRKQDGPGGPPPPHTLSSFLEENFRLVSVFGILIAVSGFAGNLAIRAMGIAISFMLLLAAIVVWLELLRKFPSGRSSWILVIFKNMMTLITFAIMLYWLLFFRDFFGPILAVGLTLLFLGISLRIGRQHRVLDRAFPSVSSQGRFLRALAKLLGILIALALAVVLAFAVTSVAAAPLSKLLRDLYGMLQSVSL